MKKFWRIFKKVMIVISALTCAALFVIVLTSAVQYNNQLLCKSINVNIDEENGMAFLSEQEIKDRINQLSGRDIIGKPVSTIDFRTLENAIAKNPFVENAEIYVNQQQGITVELTQKRPILRVINNDGVSYYIGEKSERIPLNDKFTPHVTVALGYVQTYKDSKRDSSIQTALYQMMEYIRQDEFLEAMIDQVYVCENGEFDLIPKPGNHIIRFGNATGQMEEKFNRLKVFYREGLSRTGWNRYRTINLEYDGQVVCEKRDTSTIK